MNRIMVCVAILALASVFVAIGYYWGGVSSQEEKAGLRKQVAGLQVQEETLQERLTDLRARANTAEMRLSQVKDQMREHSPTGPLAELFALVRKQVEEGANPERLAYLIQSGDPPKNCKDRETLHFTVATPAYDGSDHIVKVPDTQISIEAYGTPSINKEGQVEAWYDPAKPVRISFSAPGADPLVRDGLFPIHQAIVFEGREYRFTIEAGAQSFARIIFDSCDYP